MKRRLIILILIAASCSGKVTITESEIKSDIFYAGMSAKPFTGKCIVVYSDANLKKEEFNYKQGILNGKATSWYKNGQIRRRGYYKMGLISGKWEFWDEKGYKTVEANYENDELNGSYVSLYANGKIREKGQFEDNRRTGKWLYYNEVGQIVPEEAN
jgi:uncharacterized protein